MPLPPLILTVLAGRTRQVLLALLMLAAPATGIAAQGSADHAPFDTLLRSHVSNGAVDYDAFESDPRFAVYLASLDRVRPAALGNAERLAYWINVYNAFTIHLINSKNERESIRNINKSFGLLRLKGPWSEPIVRAAGRVLTLDQVEHEIIRQEFDEPRIHFALVCAAIGCPPLRSEAYTGVRLEQQLEQQGRIFIRESPAKNRVDVANRTVYVSPVFTWFAEDFGNSDRGIATYLAKWYPPGPERTLLEGGAFRLVKTDYDWTLNAR